MSSIIAADSPIQQPYDKFWDSPPTRRELQKAFNKIGNNQDQMFGMIDTQALVGNFLCEKFGVTRGELDAYVAKKAAEINSMKPYDGESAGEPDVKLD